MTGSQYASLYRRSVDDLRSLAETLTEAARKILGHPSVAEDHLRRAERTTDAAEKRRLYIAAFREAHFEAQQIPGNDLLGDLIEINTPKDVKNEIEALRASYEIVNQTAKGRSDWDAHYRDFQQFYDKNKNPGWLTTSQSTVNQIRDRARRLEEWKEQLVAEGVKIREPAKKPAPKNGVKGTLDSATIMILVAAGAILLLRR